MFPAALSAGEDQNGRPLVNIPATADGIDLAPYLYYWHSQTPEMEIMLKAYNQGEFSLLKTASINMGFRSGIHWFMVELKNATAAERKILLEIDYPILDHIDVYCLNKNGNIGQWFQGGDAIDYHARPIYVRNYVFPLKLNASQLVRCFIRVHSSSNIVLPIRAYDEISYIERNQFVDRNIGAVYGVAIALLLYCFILVVSTREKLYFYFTIHMLTSIAYLSLMDGTWSSFWIPLGLQNISLPIALALSTAAFVSFTIEFLELKTFYRFWYVLGRILVGISLLLLVTLFMVPMQWILASVSALIFVVCIYCILVGVHRWISQYRLAIIYLIGFTSLFLMVIWIVLNLFGMQGDVRWIIYGGHLAWISELLVLSLAIGIKAKTVEQDNLVLAHKIIAADGANRNKSDFIAMLDHEVRTPVKGILGVLEMLTKTSLDKRQARYLDSVRNVGKVLLNVTDSVTDIANNEQSSFVSALDKFNLLELVYDAYAMGEYGAKQKKIRLSAVISVGTPLDLIGDGAKVRQVLLNLVFGSIKRTEYGGICIRVFLTDRIHNDNLILRFQVEDTGVGINQSEQEKLLQGDLSTDIGLKISQKLVSALGGQMNVQSELGKGACFWFDLPVQLSETTSLAEMDLVIPEVESKQLMNQADNRRVNTEKTVAADSVAKVLVVEDNPVNQDVITEFLKKMAVEVELVENGLQALQRAKQADFDFDLILMDCETPVMNGYEAATKITQFQAENNLKVIPIIALSAHTLQEYRQKALDAGMVDFISKPIRMKTLRTQLSRYLALPDLPG